MEDGSQSFQGMSQCCQVECIWCHILFQILVEEIKILHHLSKGEKIYIYLRRFYTSHQDAIKITERQDDHQIKIALSDVLRYERMDCVCVVCVQQHPKILLQRNSVQKNKKKRAEETKVEKSKCGETICKLFMNQNRLVGLLRKDVNVSWIIMICTWIPPTCTWCSPVWWTQSCGFWSARHSEFCPRTQSSCVSPIHSVWTKSANRWPSPDHLSFIQPSGF